MRYGSGPGRRRLAWAVVVLAVVGAAGGAWWHHQREAAEARSRAVFDRIAAAVQEFETAVVTGDLAPESRPPLARLSLTLIEAELGDPDRIGLAWAWRGRVRELLGAEDDARGDYQRACEAEPRQAVTRAFRGWRGLRDYASRRGLSPALWPAPVEAREEREQRLAALADLRAAMSAGRTIGFTDSDRRMAQAAVALWGERGDEAAGAAALLEGEASPRALALRGLALHAAGRRAEAAQALEGAVRARPGDGLAWLFHAWTGLALGGGERLRDAEAAATHAIELMPGACQARVARGHARLGLSAIRGALADFDGALAIHPRCVPAFHGRSLAWHARARAETGDSRPALESSLADLNAALGLSPGFARARRDRVAVLMSLADAARERNEDATEAYRKVIAEASDVLFDDPEAARVLLHRADAHVALGTMADGAGGDGRADFAQAVSDYGAALALVDDPADARAMRGAALLLQGDAEARRGMDPRESYRRAIEEFAAAVELRPDDGAPRRQRAQAHIRLAGACRTRGEDASAPQADAELDLRSALERGDRRAWFELGELYRGMDRPEDAIAAYERAAHELPATAPRARSRADELRDALEGSTTPWLRDLALARIARAGGDFTDAHRHFLAALSALEEEPAEQRAFERSDPRLRAALAEAHLALAGILALRAGGRIRLLSGGEDLEDLRDEAFLHLKEAASLGFADAPRARREPDLEPLREDARFAEWLSRLR